MKRTLKSWTKTRNYSEVFPLFRSPASNNLPIVFVTGTAKGESEDARDLLHRNHTSVGYSTGCWQQPWGSFQITIKSHCAIVLPRTLPVPEVFPPNQQLARALPEPVREENWLACLRTISIHPVPEQNSKVHELKKTRNEQYGKENLRDSEIHCNNHQNVSTTSASDSKIDI